MYGRIITVSTRTAVSRHAPEERENDFCTNGTSTVMPTRPYTTEGMPASSATQLRAAAAMRGGAALARNTAVKRPSGTPRSSAVNAREDERQYTEFIRRRVPRLAEKKIPKPDLPDRRYAGDHKIQADAQHESHRRDAAEKEDPFYNVFQNLFLHK